MLYVVVIIDVGTNILGGLAQLLHLVREKFTIMTFRLFSIFSLLLLASCASNEFGTQVKEPFMGAKYESNARFFRAVGKGSSKMDNIATSKAELEVRQRLAQQISTTIQVVSDSYSQDVGVESSSDVMDRFESLVREVTNTNLADLRMMGREKYKNAEGVYTVFVAYEIKKAAMYRHLKKQNRISNKLSAAEKDQIDAYLDRAIKEAEAAD